MATMKIDQLNSPTEQVVESRNIIPIDEYFDDMYLTESEKEERKDLAKNLYVILSAILTIIKANEVLKNPHDTEYYKDYIASNLEILFDNVFGSGSYRSLIESFANEFVDSTMRHIDTPYFTSDDRAIVNAEQQSNAVYNQKQYEDAIASGKTRKTWVTMHDKRVRASHDATDGQEVEINKPFEIGSSELLFPGDLSLGANLKEICNCRCVVVYSGHKDTEDSLKEPQNDDKMKSPLIPMNLQFFASKEKQYGKKIGKHAMDFGLDPSKEEDRNKMHQIIDDIVNNSTEKRIGSWRGQPEDVIFNIKNNDVVITKQNGEFITVLKDGVINSEGVKNARTY